MKMDNEINVSLTVKEEVLKDLKEIDNALDSILEKMTIIESECCGDEVADLEDVMEFKMNRMLEDTVFQIIHNTLLTNNAKSLLEISTEIYNNLNEYWDDCDEI